MGTGFAWAPPYTLTPGQPSPGITYPAASLHCLPPHSGSDRSIPKDRHPLSNRVSALARTLWYRNINRLCIDYAFRPRLSPRLTLGGLALPRNPWEFGGEVSHPSFATHACILTRVASTAGSPRRFTRHTTLSYRSARLDHEGLPIMRILRLRRCA